MKKMVPTGDSEVVRFIKELFPETRHDYCDAFVSCYCGFICPGIMEAFEVLEDIELPHNQILKPGIYCVLDHQGGNTSHYIQLLRWENLSWVYHTGSNVGWEGDKMVNWSGIRRANVQGELNL